MSKYWLSIGFPFVVIMEPFCFHSLINWFNTLKVCFVFSVFDSSQLKNKKLSLTSKTFKFEDILFPQWIRRDSFLILLWPYILIMLALRLRWYWYVCCSWYGPKQKKFVKYTFYCNPTRLWWYAAIGNNKIYNFL